MSTNAHPRAGAFVGGDVGLSDVAVAHFRHARQAYVASLDATSAGRDDSGRQRPRVAPSADRNVNVVQRQGPLRQRPQRQRAATSAGRDDYVA